MTNTVAAGKELVSTALAALFTEHVADAVDRYLSPRYIQHSALAADGREPVRALVAGLGNDVRYENARMFQDGDLIVAHGVYHGLGPEPMIGFDLFRVENGSLAEHWDALTPVVPDPVSGHGQLDGPATVQDPTATAANRALVSEFVTNVLIGGDYAALPGYFHGQNYIQHNPGIADGLSGLTAALDDLDRRGLHMVYRHLHHIVAEGEFVFTQSEGSLGERPYAFYDLFRVEGGKIAEHWDVMTAIPDPLPHDNGAF